MKFDHSFRVDLPLERAWEVLVDLERVATCMPGVTFDGFDDDEYRGSVSVRVGMLSATYAGRARLVEADPVSHRIVVRASGTEPRGSGRASATVTASLHPDDEATRVGVVTDLNVSGRMAQLGRGMLGNISGQLLDEFVDNLQRELRAERSSSPDPADEPRSEAVDLVALAAPSMRRARLAIVIGLAGLLAVWFGRRRPRRSPQGVAAWPTPAAR